jgi:hypothetical protein
VAAEVVLAPDADADTPAAALLERLRSVVPDRLVLPHAPYVLVEPSGLMSALPPWLFGRLAQACLAAGGAPRGASPVPRALVLNG